MSAVLDQLAAKAEATYRQLVEDLVDGKKVAPDLCQPVAAAVGKTLRELSNAVNHVAADKRAQEAFEATDWQGAIDAARTAAQAAQADVATAKAALELAQTAAREAHQRAEAASNALQARHSEKVTAEREFKRALQHVDGDWRNFTLDL